MSPGSSSRRRPDSSVIVSHPTPIRARTASLVVIVDSIASAHGSPGRSESTSMKTNWSPNCALSRSRSRAAYGAVSLRR
jgi:hypothetical protein